MFGATLLPETKGKSLAEVSDYFYVCCAFNKKVDDKSDVKYKIVSDDKTCPVSTSVLDNNDNMVNSQEEKMMSTLERLKHKSAPIVKMEELDQLL